MILSTSRSVPSATLTRILESPDLVNQVQSLPAPSLLRIIHRIGLEDSAELLALATGEQLLEMLDEDLWRPGDSGEEIDPERLLVWLGTLSELGTTRAAERLSQMDEEFLCHALGQFLHAIDLEALRFMQVNVIGDSWSDERLEKMIGDCNTMEIGESLVIAKQGAPWEYLQPLLLDLDQEDQSLCNRVLYRLRKVTEAKAEKEGGLYEVLSEEEMLEGDASFSRNLRRTKQGFVSGEDAKAFLSWIQATPAERIRKGVDPVSREYFRTFEGAPLKSVSRTKPLDPLLLELLGEEEKAVNPLQLTFDRGQSPFTLYLAAKTEEKSSLLTELNFLAQVLMRAESSLRESEAAEKVIRICDEGLARAGQKSGELSPIQLFGLGAKKA